MSAQINYTEQLIKMVYTGQMNIEQSGAYITVKVDNRDKVKQDLYSYLTKNKIPHEDIKTSKSSFTATKLKSPDNKYIYIIYKSLKAGGSGAGAEVTELGECAQCWYTAVAFNFGKLKVYEDFIEGTTKVASKCDTTVDVDIINKKLTDNWVESAVEIANFMLTMPQFKRNMKAFKFHRGSSVVGKINDMFKQCNQKENLFANINKWSPADIWLITNKGEHIINSANVRTFAELNSLITNLYKTEDAIGVSLKLTKTAPHYEVFNYEKTENVAEFKNFKISDKSKDGYIQFSYKADQSMTIQFRSFSPVSAWQGEIKGKYAAGGKIGGGQVAAIVSRISGSVLSSNNAKVVAQMANNADKKIYTGIIDYAKDIGIKLEYGVLLNQSPDWLYSKFLTLELFSVFKALPKDKQSQILTEIVGYSSSATENSGVFIKIS